MDPNDQTNQGTPAPAADPMAAPAANVDPAATPATAVDPSTQPAEQAPTMPEAPAATAEPTAEQPVADASGETTPVQPAETQPGQ